MKMTRILQRGRGPALRRGRRCASERTLLRRRAHSLALRRRRKPLRLYPHTFVLELLHRAEAEQAVNADVAAAAMLRVLSTAVLTSGSGLHGVHEHALALLRVLRAFSTTLLRDPPRARLQTPDSTDTSQMQRHRTVSFA